MFSLFRAEKRIRGIRLKKRIPPRIVAKIFYFDSRRFCLFVVSNPLLSVYDIPLTGAALHSLFLSFSLNERHEQDIDKKIASSSDSPCGIIRRFPVPRDVISQSRYALMAVEKLHHPYIPSLSLALRLSPPCPPRKFHRQYLSWLGILFLLYNSSFIVKEKREVTG